MPLVRALAAVLVTFFATASFAATFTVTHSGDAGPGSLRQAILDANANPGPDDIRFNSDVSNTASLPPITSPVTIDGDRAGVRTVITLLFAFDFTSAFHFTAGSDGSSLRRVDVRQFVFPLRIATGVTNVVVTGGVFDQLLTEVRGDNNRIGGSTAADGNLIGHLTVRGNANEFYRNQIRTFIVGTGTGSRIGDVANGNQIRTLFLSSTTAVAEGNVFSNPAAGDAITVSDSADATITGNSISGYDAGIVVLGSATHAEIVANSLFGNGIPIDLGDDGPTPNDAAPDSDVGPSGLQNFAVLTSATLQDASLQVHGTLTSAPLTTYLIELFSNDAADAEARTLFASFEVTTDAIGHASFTRTVTSPLPTADEVITSTATNRTTGDTSEASAPVSVDAPGQLAVSATSITVNEEDGSVTITVNRNGGSEGTVTVQYATANGTATAPSDYTATSGTLTFGPGVTTQQIMIPIVNDAVPEPAETFSLTLSNATGGAALGAVTTTITIAAQISDAPTLSTWALLVLVAGITLVALRR